MYFIRADFLFGNVTLFQCFCVFLLLILDMLFLYDWPSCRNKLNNISLLLFYTTDNSNVLEILPITSYDNQETKKQLQNWLLLKKF